MGPIWNLAKCGRGLYLNFDVSDEIMDIMLL